MKNATQITIDSAFPMNVERALSTVAARRNGTSQLSNNARLLVAELLRVLDSANPRLAIRLSTAKLTEFLGMSARSIQRIKSELEEAGWITRFQSKSRRYGMQISDVTFTEKALIALELVKSKSAKSESKTQFTPKSEIKFPSELKILEERGMSVWSIFSLMKIAKNARTRLGDVVECLKENLDKVQNLYGYIKASIIKGGQRNWSEHLSKKKQTAEENAAVALAKTEAEARRAKEVADANAISAELDANMGLTAEKLKSLFTAMPEREVFDTVSGRKARYKQEAGFFYSYKFDTCSWGRMTHVSNLYFLMFSGKLAPSA